MTHQTPRDKPRGTATDLGASTADQLTEAIDMPPAPQQVQVETMTRWGDDGGALPPADPNNEPSLPMAPPEPINDPAPESAPDLTNAELVQLRVRVIALENMLVALMADVTEGQLAKVRAMAAHIVPRDGQAPHPLTTNAAAHMLSLLHRAEQWDSGASLRRTQA